MTFQIDSPIAVVQTFLDRRWIQLPLDQQLRSIVQWCDSKISDANDLQRWTLRAGGGRCRARWLFSFVDVFNELLNARKRMLQIMRYSARRKTIEVTKVNENFLQMVWSGDLFWQEDELLTSTGEFLLQLQEIRREQHSCNERGF